MQATFVQPIKTNGRRFTIPSGSLTVVRTGDVVAGAETKDNKALIDALSASKVYQDYERAFSEITGLPVTLRPVESWNLPHHGKRYENPFCAMMATKSKTCAACLRLQQKLSDAAQHEPKTMSCELGLCDTAVPVRLGDKLIGFLQTGQIFRSKPTEAQFKKTTQLLVDWQVELDQDHLRKNFFNTRVLSGKEYEAMVKLLSIFAQHISMISNQIVVQKGNAEPILVARARQYIEEKQSEDLSLTEVAKAVNTSTFYFCKMFKKATGLHFTEYVSRVRIEKAKNLLLNPNLRISEVAYEIGFQSLTHFNRVFKKFTGQSPTAYRNQLA